MISLERILPDLLELDPAFLDLIRCEALFPFVGFEGVPIERARIQHKVNLERMLRKKLRRSVAVEAEGFHMPCQVSSISLFVQDSLGTSHKVHSTREKRDGHCGAFKNACCVAQRAQVWYVGPAYNVLEELRRQCLHACDLAGDRRGCRVGKR